MALSDIDRKLLERCLANEPGAWDEFVGRFLGLVIHVINHTAQSRSIQIDSADRDDLSGEVFLAIVKDDFAVLRRFRGSSSLATYLTVVTRRIVVRELLRRKSAVRLSGAPEQTGENGHEAEQVIDSRDEVERLLKELSGNEAEVVRLFHLEDKTYQEIADITGVPENSIGPTLSRARAKMRGAGADSATS